MSSKKLLRAWLRRASALCCGLVLALPSTGVRADTLAISDATELSASASGSVIVLGIAGRLWRRETSGALVALTDADMIATRPRLSPDGSRVLYEDTRDGVSHVAVLDLGRNEPRLLTEGATQDLTPAWQPDGSHLVFASNRSGHFAIWELGVDDGVLRRLTFEAGEQIDPAPDPSGSRIAFVVPAGAAAGLYVQPIHGGAASAPAQCVVRAGNLRGPAWRPDGAVISYATGGAAWYRLQVAILSNPPVVKDLDRREIVSPYPASWLDRGHLVYAGNGRLRRRELAAPLFEELPIAAELTLAPRAPDAAPTAWLDLPVDVARSIRGITSLPDGGVVISAVGDLWQLASDGNLVQRLTNDIFANEEPAASPDGRLLAFTSEREGIRQVWLRELATGLARRLTAEAGGALHPAWAPGGDRLAYVAVEGLDGAAALKTIGLNGGASAILGQNHQPGWRDHRNGHAPVGVTEVAVWAASARPVWSPDATHIALIGPADPTEDRPSTARMLLFATDDSTPLRHAFLFSEAVQPGAVSQARSPDGKELAVASSAGLVVLPLGADGMPGAQWRRVSTATPTAVTWDRDGKSLWYVANGLHRLTPGPEDPLPSTVPLPAEAGGSAPAGRFVIRAGRVFDAESGQYQMQQDIVVAGNRVVELHGWDSAEPPATILDASKATVTPGLVDAFVGAALRSPVADGRRLLAFGVTTAAIASDDDARMAATAELWRLHRAGPRVVPLTPPCRGPMSATAASAWLAVVRGGARALWSLGRPGGESGCGPLATPLYQDAIATLARFGTPLVPALISYSEGLVLDGDSRLLRSERYLAQYASAERRPTEMTWSKSRWPAESDGARRFVARAREVTGLLAAGGRVAAASHSALLPPGFGLHAELAALSKAGVTSAQGLQAATYWAALALGVDQAVGRIRPGLLADMLIIDGDPLHDSLDLLRIQSVVFDGRVIPWTDLAPPSADAAEKFTVPPRGNQPAAETAPGRTRPKSSKKAPSGVH